MALVRDSVAGFIGGVSQQPDKLMFPNQCRKLLNMTPDPIQGLTKRKPTQHIKRLMNALTIHPLTHTIVKEDEQYIVFLTGSGVKVFDLLGNEKTVKADDVSYITTNNPLKDLSATTIADYTFITNKTVVAKMKDDLYPNPHPNGALIFVRQGDFGIDYIVNVDGKEVAKKSTDDQSSLDHKTNTIAKSLYDQMVKNLPSSDWNIKVVSSTIFVERKDKQPFKLQTTDSNAGRNLYNFQKETGAMDKLPLTAPNGFILKITGDDGDTSDDYYVQFSTADNSSFGTGTWKECCSPNEPYSIDAATMPHVLIRQSDGTFEFKAATWSDRRAGDKETAKIPSIFGSAIKEVFTYKGRLGFIAGDRAVFTDVDDIFSLFKRTVMTSLDTDPIDVGSNSKMVLLQHSLPYNEELMVFSPNSVFTITSGDVFSNKTVGIDLTMEYPCSTLCRPINIGETALFPYENGEYSGVYEIYVASTYTTSARSTTEHIPNYLPAGIYKLTGNTYNNIACALSEKDKRHVYTYNFYYTSESKAQSAWGKWEFSGDVLGAEFVNTELYLAIQYEDGVYLEKLNTAPKQSEKDVNFLFHIDRKTKPYNVFYDKHKEATFFELPYIACSKTGEAYKGLILLDKNGFPLKIKQLFIGGNSEPHTTGYIKGNHENEDIYVGFEYESLWEMGTTYYRSNSSNGSVKVVEGLLMLKDFMLSYLDTGYFKARVIPKYSTQMTSEYEFTGGVTGTISATLGKLTPYSDTFIIPIMSKNEDVTVQFINDSYLPSTFSSLTWLGELSIRGKDKM